MTKIVGIYKITSPSGKVYIGQSWDIKKRWAAYNGSHYSQQTKIYNSIKKYGITSHSFEIVLEFLPSCTQEELDESEKYYIAQYKKMGVVLLNIRGGGSRGKLSTESIEKLRKAHTGKKHTPEHREKNRLQLLGRIHSQETKIKMAAAHIGRIYPPITEEGKLKRSLANKGRLFSDETKEKMSKSSKGRKLSEQAKRKLSEGAKGRKASDETKKKMSAQRMGNKYSLGVTPNEQTREKLSQASKLNWEKLKAEGFRHSEESKRKMSEAAKLRKLSEETRLKISEAGKGRIYSSESKARMSEATKKHWIKRKQQLCLPFQN